VTDDRRLLARTAELAADFLESLDSRPIAAEAGVDELRAALHRPLPDDPTDPEAVVEELAAAAELGVVGIPSGRYFGFVIGGGLPAALAADWLTSTWDQNAGLYACGPSAAIVEEVVGEWLKELLRIPPGASFALATGCQMAHATCLAAARNAVLADTGWAVEVAGLAGAPRISVLSGAKRHATIDRAVRLLGLGTGSITPIAADGEGRMDVAQLRGTLAEIVGPTIVCAQLGEVNTGSCDPIEEIADAVEGTGAWLHVDGAFGLWAAASPSKAHLVAGHERADSWTTDAHKWLNVPYDCGIAFVARPEHHRAAMTVRAEYLVQDPDAARDEVDWTPEFSRRARGFAVYAGLRSLGRNGVAALVDRCCAHAQRFAQELARLPGCEILNEVVLNQVLLRFEDDETTRIVLREVQESGEAWMSGTSWDGRDAIRVSVSNWRTSDDDVRRAVAAFARALERAGAPA
jgi:glutamate/tyrosine decarboxylase-like PLP-dependent enzyme